MSRGPPRMDITPFVDMLRTGLSSLRGRIERLFPSLRRDMQLIVTGLNGAGKSTLLRQLHLGEVQQLPVAISFTVECIWHEKVSIRSWDVGGTDKIRPLYRNFFDGAHAVVFVVNASNQEQLPHAKREIERLMAEPELADVKLIVLVLHKQHGRAAISGAAETHLQMMQADDASLNQVMQVLNLDEITHDWGAFRVELGLPTDAASTASGVWEAFEWLEQRLQQRSREPRRWIRGTSGYEWSDKTYSASPSDSSTGER